MFRSTKISSNSSKALFWLTSMYGPFWESCVRRILYPVKATSFQSSEPPYKSLLRLVKTRCSISFPPVPKRPSTNRLMIPATDFPAAGHPDMGSSVFSNAASTSDCSRDLVKAYFEWFRCATELCPQCSRARSRDCIEYRTWQHRSARVGIMPWVRSALSRMFQQSRGASFIPCTNFFSLAAIYTTSRFTSWDCPWRKGGFEIHVETLPTFAGCHLATLP